jgi:hypothetical protein
MASATEVISERREIVSVVVIMIMVLAVIGMVRNIEDDRKPHAIRVFDSSKDKTESHV